MQDTDQAHTQICVTFHMPGILLKPLQHGVLSRDVLGVIFKINWVYGGLVDFMYGTLFITFVLQPSSESLSLSSRLCYKLG